MATNNFAVIVLDRDNYSMNIFNYRIMVVSYFIKDVEVPYDDPSIHTCIYISKVIFHDLN